MGLSRIKMILYVNKRLTKNGSITIIDNCNMEWSQQSEVNIAFHEHYALLL